MIFDDSSLNTGVSTVYRTGVSASLNLFSGFGTVASNLAAYHRLRLAKETLRQLSERIHKRCIETDENVA